MTDSSRQVDRYLSSVVRSQIEEQYLAPINAQARLENALHDPSFYQNPGNYPPFYADHGVVHSRDVAHQVLRVLDTACGLLIPARDHNRLEFMKGYGVLLAYTHDIGMVDFSHFGRVVHAPFATQAVFSPEFDGIIRAIWDENSGNLAWRLTRLAGRGALEQDAPTVMREMLSLSNCHSKSRVSKELLYDPSRLRKLMQERARTDLRAWYQQQQMEGARRELQRAQDNHDGAGIEEFTRLLDRAERALEAIEAEAPVGRPLSQGLHGAYVDFERESYQWLVSPHEEANDLASDVLDTIRALRCADALRQRGAVLKTSGGYEVFVDRKTANANLALRLGGDQLLLLETSHPLSSGEANIAGSELDPDGNLRVSFHRGAFPQAEITRRAAYCAALVVNDIQGDAIESFDRPVLPGIEPAGEMEILLESTDDNLEFAESVRLQLVRINPQAAARTRCVPSLQNASARELARYLEADELDWDAPTCQQALDRIAKSGHRTGDIDPDFAFRDVRLVRLAEGEDLIEAGAPSGFVYIPLAQGLEIKPLGGYQSFPAPPWMLLGITGVIRGAKRNASVIAGQTLPLLAIPKDVYLKEWHHTYSIEELAQLLARKRDAMERDEGQSTLSGLEKVVILQTVPLFAEIGGETLAELAAIVTQVRREPGKVVLEKGDPGDSMYIIVDGRVRVHDGEHTLNHLEKGQVFGEMALLDSEPRMASVTAVEGTDLLRLDQGAFYDLMASQPDVLRGILRILARHLRARAKDVTELRARVQALSGEDG